MTQLRTIPFLVFLILLLPGLLGAEENGLIPSETSPLQQKISKWKELREKDPAAFEQKIRERKSQLKNHLQQVKQENPEKFEKLQQRFAGQRRERMENLRKENPERFQQVMQNRMQRLESFKEKNPQAAQEFLKNHPRAAERMQNRTQRLEQFQKQNPEKAQRFLQNHPKFQEKIKNKNLSSPQTSSGDLKNSPLRENQMPGKFEQRENFKEQRRQEGNRLIQGERSGEMKKQRPSQGNIRPRGEPFQKSGQKFGPPTSSERQGPGGGRPKRRQGQGN